MTTNGIFFSGSGEFNIQSDANNYIRKSGSLFIINVASSSISGSSVIINTPNFYLGSSTAYISGSGTRMEMSASGFLPTK